MKKIVPILLAVFALSFGAYSQTNTADAASTVQLTTDQTAKLDNGVNSLTKLLPASSQSIVNEIIEIMGFLVVAGRAISGFKRDGIGGVISGLFLGHNGTPNPPPATVPKGATGLTKGATMLRDFIIRQVPA